MSPHPQDSAARSPEGSTLCSAAAVNYNDSGSHKNVPHPPPTPLNPPDRVCILLSCGIVVANVCVLVLRHPLPFRNISSARPLDASWRSLLKALKSSPFALRLVFRSVSLPPPPPFLMRSYFLRTDCKDLPWFLPVKTACFVPCP